jgi:branched-chain amino acid transport system permease protein
MTDTPSPNVPDSLTAPAADAGPAVGVDEWVARHAEHRFVRRGPLGVVEERLRTLPWWSWMTLFVCVTALIPVGFSSGYVRRVAFDTTLYMLLALGLNVVVGWGGLLDLGYIAFYGIGAYSYALLDSNQFDIHLPTVATVPVVLVIGAVVGLLVGLPSWRLSGDYLAIVTLFFFQIFIVVVTNGDHLFGHNVTGGSNGIGGVDANMRPFNLFGHDVAVAHNGVFNIAYLYIALAFFAVAYVLLRFVNDSRIGRSWRSLREDPLAAELMGMPVNWLKLLAFSFGATVAAVSGTIFAALNAGVFPTTFAFPLLITIYTMVILGGSGSQAGVVIGAVIVNVLLELLRDVGNSRYVFYAVVVAALFAIYKVSMRLAVVLGATVALGFVVHAVASAISKSAVDGAGNGGGWLFDGLKHWVVVPESLGAWRVITYIGLIAAVLALTLVRDWVRVALIVPTLYLAAFVWENVMLAHPEATRFIVLGAILVAVMVARPSGILGERRVEII